MEEQVSFDVLRDRMANIGADLLVETIENLEERRQKSTIQDETMVTHAPRIHLADSQIDWLNDTTESIYARFLAYGSKVSLYLILDTPFYLLSGLIQEDPTCQYCKT